jgi:hypothetical protein
LEKIWDKTCRHFTWRIRVNWWGIS